MKYTVLITCLFAASAYALSPFDNYRQHIEERRTGELGYLAEGTSLEEAGKVFNAEAKAIAQSLKKQKASNLSVFGIEDVNGQTLILAHRYDPVSGKPSKIAWPDKVKALLTAHEHAGRQREGETVLLDMELICHLPCAVDKKPAGPVQRYGLVTELRPEMEEKYRTLHQTVWPGVVEQIARSNIRHWTTWCTEIKGKIYLVAYFEYIGADKAADDAYMAEDPTTQRWWKITDACQRPLPQQEGKDGPWSAMVPLLHVD